MKDLGNNFFIDTRTMGLKFNNGITDLVIPWNVVHSAVEYQKVQPLGKRADVIFCTICNQPIKSDKYDKHLAAHGEKNG